MTTVIVNVIDDIEEGASINNDLNSLNISEKILCCNNNTALTSDGYLLDLDRMIKAKVKVDFNLINDNSNFIHAGEHIFTNINNNIYDLLYDPLNSNTGIIYNLSESTNNTYVLNKYNWYMSFIDSTFGLFKSVVVFNSELMHTYRADNSNDETKDTPINNILLAFTIDNIYLYYLRYESKLLLYKYSFFYNRLETIYDLNDYSNNIRDINYGGKNSYHNEFSNVISFRTDEYMYKLCHNDICKYRIKPSYKLIKSNGLCVRIDRDHYIFKTIDTNYRINLNQNVEYMYVASSNKVFYSIIDEDPIDNTPDNPPPVTTSVNIMNLESVKQYLVCMSKKINRLEQEIDALASRH